MLMKLDVVAMEGIIGGGDLGDWLLWGAKCVVGTAGGALTGGVAGAGVGSVVPGLGTAAGGIIGGAGGAATGAVASGCFDPPRK
jgi:hypothetical protein